MNYQKAVKAIVYVTVLAWTVCLLANHQTLQSGFLRLLLAATTAVLWFVVAFELWLWKMPFLHGWLVKLPVVDGTWKVEIRSNWVDPETQQRRGPIVAYMVIRQTLTTLSMKLLTEESTSTLQGTEIVYTPGKLYCIGGVYQNEPRFGYRHRSEVHYGGLWLGIADDSNEKTIAGHYWTDRNTAGSMRLSNRISRKSQSFEEADVAFGSQKSEHE